MDTPIEPRHEITAMATIERSARVRTDTGVRTGTVRTGTDGDPVVSIDSATYSLGGDGNADVDLLAPCEPSALYCVGRNYAETIALRGYDRPDEPTFFIKPPTAVLDPGARIPYPTFSAEVTYAGELAAVIGMQCKNVSPADAPGVVQGYTILNDVDALDQSSLSARKAFDGAAPLGPWITDVDPHGIDMRTTINGEVRQEANTDAMLFEPEAVISFLSERLTLRPGDVVSFGSPANPGLIEPGDEIEISYEGVGTLVNTVGRIDRTSTTR